jgi:hypothetical protein
MSHHPHAGHYSEGQQQEHTVESDRVGSFAEGQRITAQAEPVPHMGHYSEGQEETRHDESKDDVGQF